MTEGQSPVDVEKIKQLIKEILAVVDAVDIPDRYKEACFKVLFSKYIETIKPTSPKIEKTTITEPIATPSTLTIPEDVKVFLGTYKLVESDLSLLFRYEQDRFIRKYQIPRDQIATMQNHVALLTALENALNKGKFEFSFDEVRARCRDDYDCYQSKNFPRNFQNNSEWYRSLSNKKHVELSPKGKAELAKTIREITELAKAHPEESTK